MPASAATCSAPRWSMHRRRRPRQSCATSVTATDRLRATGHTASDNVETVLYRLVSSGRPGGIKPKREDGVVRPLLTVWREETEAYCPDVGLPYRTDSTNVDTKRGLIRTELLPLLERLDARARESPRARRGPSRPAYPARSSERCSTCSRPRTARRRPTSATASTPCASTTV